MTDGELLIMVKEALETAPNAGNAAERAAISSCHIATEADSMAAAHMHVLAAAVRGAHAYRHRARQLRAEGK